MVMNLNYLKKLSKIKIETTGADLIELGFLQGKIFKEILNYITEQKVANPNLTTEQELQLVKEKFL